MLKRILPCVRNDEAAALGFSAADGVAEGALAAHAPLAISCWRGRASVNHMVARPEAAQLAEKLRAALLKRDGPAPEQASEQPAAMEAEALPAEIAA